MESPVEWAVFGASLGLKFLRFDESELATASSLTDPVSQVPETAAEVAVPEAAARFIQACDTAIGAARMRLSAELLSQCARRPSSRLLKAYLLFGATKGIFADPGAFALGLVGNVDAPTRRAGGVAPDEREAEPEMAGLRVEVPHRHRACVRVGPLAPRHVAREAR